MSKAVSTLVSKSSHTILTMASTLLMNSWRSLPNKDLTLSGVSAHFQNGVVENAIKLVVQKACTMMVHATLWWPGYSEKTLWPMAMSHSTYLHNHTPNQESGLAPIKIFTQTKSNHSTLQNAIHGDVLSTYWTLTCMIDNWYPSGNPSPTEANIWECPQCTQAMSG